MKQNALPWGLTDENSKYSFTLLVQMLPLSPERALTCQPVSSLMICAL